MRDPLLAARDHAAGGDWLGAASRGNKFPGWQVIVADTAQPALLGQRQKHAIADEITAGVRAPTIFVWQCQRALIVAHSQTRWPGYGAAAAALTDTGWPVLVRWSGGGAFPIGPGTVQIAMIARYPDHRISMDSIYERLSFLIGSALAEFGVAVRIGGTPGAFCNGRRDLVVGDRKIAGLAQHWRPSDRGQRSVTAEASVLVNADLGELTSVVNRFHAMCGQTTDFRAEAMTTIADSCAAGARSCRDLTAEFLAHFGAVCRRDLQPLYS